MKANAPERIWIDNLDEGFWFDNPSGNKSVEYTRTDAFVEKACEFLRDHLEGYDIFGNDIDRSIESFKLAMTL